jgi:hypothetical protein
MSVPWNDSEEYLKYLSRLSFVAADCRLRLDEEEIFLKQADVSQIEVKNRRSVLKALKSDEDPPAALEIAYPENADSTSAFEYSVDKAQVHPANVILASGTFAIASYMAPTAELGVGCIQFLNKMIENSHNGLPGILAGAPSSHSMFLLCYELLCGHLNLKILEDDEPRTLGYLLAKFIPFAPNLLDKMLWGILVIAMFNPKVAPTLPGYDLELQKVQGKAESNGQPSNFFVQVVDILRGPVDFAKQNIQFFRQVTEKIAEADKCEYLVWPISESPDTPPRFIPFVREDMKSLKLKTYRLYHGLTLPLKIEISCAKRCLRPTQNKKGVGDKVQLTEKAIVDLSTIPMLPFGLDQWISNIRAIEQPTEVFPSQGQNVIDRFLKTIPIQNSPVFNSRNAMETVDRLARDWDLSRRIEEKTIPNELVGFSKSDVQGMTQHPNHYIPKALSKIGALHQALIDFNENDDATAHEMIEEFLSTVYHTGQHDFHRAAFNLAHDSGQVPEYSFEYFTSLLLDDAWDVRLSEINPYLDSSTIRRSESLLVGAILRFSRAGLVARCISTAKDLIETLTDSLSSQEKELATVLNGVSLKSAALAEMLSTRRGYAEVVRRDGVHVEYDPRFLLFEFSSNIILRDAQIRLVRSFVAAVDNGESLCHQLIMGAGKTTVIAPLLALILGSPKRLVVQVRYFLIVEFCHVSAGLF